MTNLARPKIVFFGSSKFSVQILKALADKADQYDLPLVITQPDRAVGRKAILTQTAIADIAQDLGLDIIKPQSLNAQETAKKIKEINPSLFLVVAYGKIIPRTLLDIPKNGSLNIHGSLLPKYRGASPIHAALMNGDNKTGISIMLMDEQMDNGPILIQREVTIGKNEVFPNLEKRLCEAAQELILQAIPKYLSGDLKPYQQDHSKATYCSVLSKEDGKIDWLDQGAKEIYDRFRAFVVWPGIWTFFEGKILKIINCEPLNESGNQSNADIVPGLVKCQDNILYVQCLRGNLKLIELQLEGKNKVSANEFINGRRNFIGARLGF